MKVSNNLFNQIIAPENLFLAWDKFKTGKRAKMDVQEFEENLEYHLFQLHQDLKNKTYKHGPYFGFYINDPKRRHTHKAIVRDRVLHHAIFQILMPIFDATFIPTSYSCRVSKGTHKGVEAVAKMLNRVSKNNTQNCYALKCDIQKFFDSVNHEVLFRIIEKKLQDSDLTWLIREIVGSYTSGTGRNERERERESFSALRADTGIPIGNLTSQLFANVYMNEFDQFMKKTLKVAYYARYTDDFIIVATNQKYLDGLIKPIGEFLANKLALRLHPNKVEIRKYTHGIDFLGYVTLPHFRILRKRTKKRMLRKFKDRMGEYKKDQISKDSMEQTLNSYLGMLSHSNGYELSQELKNKYWLE